MKIFWTTFVHQILVTFQSNKYIIYNPRTYLGFHCLKVLILCMVHILALVLSLTRDFVILYSKLHCYPKH